MQPIQDNVWQISHEGKTFYIRATETELQTYQVLFDIDLGHEGIADLKKGNLPYTLKVKFHKFENTCLRQQPNHTVARVSSHFNQTYP